MQPELHIPPRRSVVFFPDFPGAHPNFLFVGLSESAGSLFQFFHQSQDTLHGFPIANPPREITVLVGLLYEAGDEMLLITVLPSRIRRWSSENVHSEFKSVLIRSYLEWNGFG